jgi:uncharacterized protein (DUF1800 family)
MNYDPLIALNRFGLGATPGELAEVGKDPLAWLLQQIRGPVTIPEALAKLPHSGEALKAYPRWIASLGASSAATSGAATPRTVESTFREQLGPPLVREVVTKLQVAASTSTPFHERLTWFWANHFAVSAEKALVFALVGTFEREAIRPHVNGTFSEMLVAATRHPAMIMYLDNHLSVRKGWRPHGLHSAQSAAFPLPVDLNENLAREILELHTLGVNGGYTQADVTEFARILTGWSARPTMFDLRPPNSGAYFDPDRHVPGPRKLLGKDYRQEGVAQGEAVLLDLASHPSTALNIATKLARHFIADDPPPDAVRRIAKAFQESGGHLPTVHAAVLACPQAWDKPLKKLKSPIEYIASCMRALPSTRTIEPQLLYASLLGMGQRPFFAPSPQGWPDVAQAWSGGDALWKRIEWAGIVAARLGNSVDVLHLATESYGSSLSSVSTQALTRAESQQQALALWLASPEFQRR